MAFMEHLSHLYLLSFAKQVVITFTFCFDGKYQEETTGVYNGSHHANRSDTAHGKHHSVMSLFLFMLHLCLTALKSITT
jgi:hypothetical protein